MSDVVRKPKLRPLSAVRLVLVVFLGPLALLAALIVAATDAVRSVRAGRWPLRRSTVILAAGAAYVVALPSIRGWGATTDERTKTLVGDETVPRPSVQHTRAVAIEAPVQDVWPWLAQIGQDRGGFYSYTWLENLAGCRMHNADRLHPHWRQRAVGDQLPLHHETGLQVLGIDAGRSLTLDGGWYFVLEPDGPGRSRLIARWRIARGALNCAFALLFDLPHFLMERKMLLGIKRRAEGASHAGAPCGGLPGHG